jgi:hypothetical protein
MKETPMTRFKIVENIITGEIVSGVVCKGFLFKGSTVRFK